MDTDHSKRPNILTFFTILSAGVSFAWLGIQEPSQWPGGVVLYILNSKSCPFFRPFRVSLSSNIMSGWYH